MSNRHQSTSPDALNDSGEYLYTVHKKYATVITESREIEGRPTWIRVLHTAQGEVSVKIDLDGVAELLARKALLSSGGKAQILNGCITAATHNVIRAQEQLGP